ncbi:DUF2062 domain-containing protein [Ruficoccus amylovorans]|uniref:DUF2062 domain-containing protein n=1 Tax=Ruficoccus amylovorans TaxID=1804625 RepID=A0A842HH99_9BACT|nr:DUF2062 domain-containing protein [Ruficoccus amylovorans]MBC2595699.1 DUF2062 domain-containing protein [Ruficoccus amylovorans]
MSSEEKKRQESFRRVRRLKRIMRPLPRRTNIHRYPVLKWFAKTARARSYLWSFRRRQVVRSIYIGCILAMLPPPTPQTPLASVLALMMRSNLMVAAGLTLITNPFTIVPIYYADYKVGAYVFDVFGKPDLSEDITPEIVELYSGDLEPEVQLSIMQRIFDGWVQTAVGGLILGILLSLILHAVYLICLRYYEKRAKGHSFRLLGKALEKPADGPEPADGEPEGDATKRPNG